MGSEWKTAKLTDHYEIRSGLSKPAKDFGSGYPFLTFKDVFYNYFTPEKLGDLVESTEKDRLGCSVLRGDVFLTRTSETMNELGMSCVALKDYENSTFNGFCKRLRPKADSELVPEYVGYYLRSPLFRRSMMAFSTMSTRASLNNEMISRLDISYPDPGEQVEIARVLKTLDEKISLNNQINQTLEQMAQTLFKSWFVDFDPVIDNALDAGSSIPEVFEARVERRKAVRESADYKPLPDDVRQLFPSEFEESELGWVPKGWEATNLSDFIKFANGKAKKSIEGAVYPLYGANGIIGQSNEAKFNDAIVIGRVGAYCGSIEYCNTSFWASDNTIVAEPKGQITHLPFVLYLLKHLNLNKFAGGAAQPLLNQKVLSSIQVPLSSLDVLESFGSIVSANLEKMFSLNQESTSLEKLRDTLLPKLISGELRLDSAEVE
ncbi:restriction endonuclease subunit S [Vibrio campbellii]|uniref:restriction endonuclease subunit S n=1 Tax=Vibrio campbellii TaxID=680 RepID=UPI00142E455C|nr:restriction endonuclease subunit S [Vibrio campbellii]NIY88514.1 restriction endonuclease subunit S [Vibrio campbellii]NVK69426.1 restriction endonuclease subunit S [Vibrio campbellii]